MNKPFLVGIIVLGILATVFSVRAQGASLDLSTALARLTSKVEELNLTIEALKGDLRQARSLTGGGPNTVNSRSTNTTNTTTNTTANTTTNQVIAKNSLTVKLSVYSPATGSRFLTGMAKIPVGIFELTNNEDEYLSITKLVFSCSHCDNLAAIRIYSNGTLVTGAIKPDSKPTFSLTFPMGNFPLKGKETIMMLVEADTNPKKEGAPANIIQVGLQAATAFNVVSKPMKVSPPVNGPEIILYPTDIFFEDKSASVANQDGYCVVKSDFLGIDLEKESWGFFKEKLPGAFRSLDEVKRACAYGHDLPAQQFCAKNPGARYRRGVLLKDAQGLHFDCGQASCSIISC